LFKPLKGENHRQVEETSGSELVNDLLKTSALSPEFLNVHQNLVD
jgi:hypothetical protein